MESPHHEDNLIKYFNETLEKETKHTLQNSYFQELMKSKYAFFKNLYKYYYEKGFTCMVTRRITNIMYFLN
jgi:hypothetical protein